MVGLFVDPTLGPGDERTRRALENLQAEQATAAQIHWNKGALQVRNSTDKFWVDLIPQSALVAASQTRSSTSYGDLTTVGPAVTLLTGTKAIVLVSAQLLIDDGESALMSAAVSGASTIAASDARALAVLTIGAAAALYAARSFVVEGLTPGSNVFTAKYRMGVGTSVTFAERHISVWGVPE